MIAPPRNARLLHTIVVMGVALTGGTLGTGCGGATLESPLTLDDGGAKDGATSDAYPTIGSHAEDGDVVQGPDAYPIIYPAPPPDASNPADAYATIGIYQGDAADDAYGTIKSPFDAGVDAYPTIEPAIDAGADGYPIIFPPPGGGH